MFIFKVKHSNSHVDDWGHGVKKVLGQRHSRLKTRLKYGDEVLERSEVACSISAWGSQLEASPASSPAHTETELSTLLSVI